MLRIYFLQQWFNFESVKDLLAEHRLLLRAGTIVDAPIIAAPSSTRNATGTRDPEVEQARKRIGSPRGSKSGNPS